MEESLPKVYRKECLIKRKKKMTENVLKTVKC